MSELQPHIYLYLSALLFSSGLYIIVTRRNAILLLIGVELIFNAGNLIFAVFSTEDLNGQVFAIFSIVITVCEVAIALAILLCLYKSGASSNLDQLKEVGNE